VAIKVPAQRSARKASAEMVVAEAAAAAGNEMSLSNMVLGFYEEAEREKWATEEAAGGGDGSDDEESGGGSGGAESSAFCQEQRSRLHVSHFPFSATRKQISVCLFRVWLLLLLNEPDSLRYTCFAYLTSCSC